LIGYTTKRDTILRRCAPYRDTEVEITAELVRDLLREQHPDLADRPLRLGARGWDNQLWRLGDDLAVRLPWATQSADELLCKEHAWLPAVLCKEHAWLPALAPKQRPPCSKPSRSTSEFRTPHRSRPQLALRVEAVCGEGDGGLVLAVFRGADRCVRAPEVRSCLVGGFS
jgi:hypothetical protein